MVDVHAEINPQDRIDDIWSAWTRMDGEATLRDIVRRAREQKAEDEFRKVEVKQLRKKRFWGVAGQRRWQLHMQHLPTSQANGTYGRLGAPIRFENMNLHRTGYHGGGPLPVSYTHLTLPTKA